MKELRFKTELIQPEGAGIPPYLDIPYDLVDAFGVRRQIRVTGTVNGLPFRAVARPHGDGTHFLVLNHAIRKTIGVKAGDTVQVVLSKDETPRRKGKKG